MKLRSVALEKQLREQAPPFSKIITAPSAYMTDEAWLEIVPLLCEGIRAMPKVSEHPEWWFGLSLDGYGSHLKEDALEIFANYRIMVVKEEGDSSQTNQAYDQLVAKEDKRIVSEMIDHLRAHNKSLLINQKYLIGISIHAISLVEAKTWEKSFIRVNMNPDHRVGIEQWLRRIDSQVAVGEREGPPLQQETGELESKYI